jgi:hypothetical protein
MSGVVLVVEDDRDCGRSSAVTPNPLSTLFGGPVNRPDAVAPGGRRRGHTR